MHKVSSEYRERKKSDNCKGISWLWWNDKFTNEKKNGCKNKYEMKGRSQNHSNEERI